MFVTQNIGLSLLILEILVYANSRLSFYIEYKELNIADFEKLLLAPEKRFLMYF